MRRSYQRERLSEARDELNHLHGEVEEANDVKMEERGQAENTKRKLARAQQTARVKRKPIADAASVGGQGYGCLAGQGSTANRGAILAGMGTYLLRSCTSTALEASPDCRK